jgi:ActR/RegA family two-component response regulator
MLDGVEGSGRSSSCNRWPVLVFDDSPQVLRALDRTLGRRGFTLTCFSSARAGCAAIRAASEPPEAAIIDLCLREGSGWDVAAALRERFPDSIPILFITGYPTFDSEVSAQLARFDARLLAKPVQSSQLDLFL